MAVADDGVGLPKGIGLANDKRGNGGYGMKLVHIIIRHIGATLHVDRIKGARLSIVVPGAYALAE